MTYDVVWDIQAAGARRRLRAEDPAGAARLTAAIEALADNPHPPNAVPMGGSGWYRLRLGPYRAVYALLPDKYTSTSRTSAGSLRSENADPSGRVAAGR